MINASVMLRLNVPDKYAMERMGHSTNNMLKNVYQHTMNDKAVAVADAVDGFLNPNFICNSSAKTLFLPNLSCNYRK